MESDGFDQVKHTKEMGQRASRGPSMLHQVCTENCAGADSWDDCRSTGVYLPMTPQAMTVADIFF